MKTNKKYGYCKHCNRYIGTGYIANEHIKLCKNTSEDVRIIHGANKNTK